MDVILERFSYAPEETEGQLFIDGYTFATIERPWIKWKTLGGKPFESCVPDGEYDLVPFVRERDGNNVYALVNHELGVYRDQSSMRGVGRYACLLHNANFAHQLLGCIAPGLKRGILKNNANGNMERAVLSSAEALRIIKSILDPSADQHRLIIRQKIGAGGTLKSFFQLTIAALLLASLSALAQNTMGPSTADIQIWLKSPVILYVLMLLGSFVSMMKQWGTAKMDGSMSKLGDYLTHLPELITTLFTNSIAFLVLIETDALTFVSAVSIGYVLNDLSDLNPKGSRSSSLVEQITSLNTSDIQPPKGDQP